MRTGGGGEDDGKVAAVMRPKLAGFRRGRGTIAVSTSGSHDRGKQKPSSADTSSVGNRKSSPDDVVTSSESSSSQPPVANWPPLLAQEQLDASSMNEAISPKSMKCSAHLESFKTHTHSSSSSSVHRSHDNTVVLEKFAESQLVRQAASLSSNRIKQSNVDGEERLINNHLSALKAALAYKHPLTCAVLQNWHLILCDGLLTTTPGAWRENSVHCGNITFCTADLGSTP